jgi:hypothetical protein
MTQQKRYYVNYAIVGGVAIEVTASSPEEAIKKADRKVGIALCHECAREVGDLEIDGVTAVLDSYGNEVALEND